MEKKNLNCSATYNKYCIITRIAPLTIKRAEFKKYFDENVSFFFKCLKNSEKEPNHY